VQEFKAQVDEAFNKVTEDSKTKSSQTSVVETEVKSLVDTEIDKSLGKQLGCRAIQIEQLQQTLTKTKASFEEEQDKEHRRNIFILYRCQKVLLRRSLVWLQSTKDVANCC